MLWQLLVQGVQILAVANRAGGQQAAVMIVVFVAIAIVGLLIGPPIASLMGFVAAGFFHLGMMIMRCATQPFEVTYRTVAYANGAPQLLLLIPVCGQMAAGIWGLVACIIGLSRTHKVEWWRVLVGYLIVLAMIVLAIVLLIGGVIAIVAALAR